MRQALALHGKKTPVVARGGHGHVLQFQHALRAALAGHGRFYRHGPGRAAGLAAQGAQFTVQRHQRLVDAVLAQHCRHAVHGIAFGNAAQVDGARGMAARALAGHVQLQPGRGGLVGLLACLLDGGGIGRAAHWAKAPGIDQGAHARVKSTAAGLAHLQRGR